MSITSRTELHPPLQALIHRSTGVPTTLLRWTGLGGGCINETYRLETTTGPYFIKLNQAHRYPGMFEQEARGLELLSKAGEIDIPKVVGTGTHDALSFLVLEYIEGTALSVDFWEDFGHRLALLHQHSNTQFGLDHSNYIGSLPQDNTFEKDWGSFFIHRRLEPQCKMAMDHHRMDVSLIRKFTRLFEKMEDLFPPEPPALLHGDLWSGNYMVSGDGKACIIDPAVYYGHREMDLGMTLLFGGFRAPFYEAYHETRPLEAGWRKRMDLCNLYPLLVHVNLFGGGYLGQVKQIVEDWL